MALTRRKYLLFVAVAALLSVAVTLVVALAADLYMHRRAERSAGLNRWGYRGPALGIALVQLTLQQGRNRFLPGGAIAEHRAAAK